MAALLAVVRVVAARWCSTVGAKDFGAKDFSPLRPEPSPGGSTSIRRQSLPEPWHENNLNILSGGA